MTNTTNEKTAMKALGVNPGMVSEYSEISLEPVSFTKESNLGHSTAWCAQHAATWNINGSRIEVEGHTIVVDNAKSQSFNALLKGWRQRNAQE